jgi:hypothetical protein
VTTPTRLRESAAFSHRQEVLAAGIERGRQEEHQRACQVMRRVLIEIAEVRFPLLAAFVRERVEGIDTFAVLHQFIFVLSTAWTVEDVLRFLVALEDVQRER